MNKNTNETQALPAIRGWIARDSKIEGGNISLYQTMPHRKEYKSTDYINFVWLSGWGGKITLPGSMFPEVTWEDEPVEVEIQIKKTK